DGPSGAVPGLAGRLEHREPIGEARRDLLVEEGPPLVIRHDRAVRPGATEEELDPHQVLAGREEGGEGGGGGRPARPRRAPGEDGGEEDDGEGGATAPGEGPATPGAVA